MKKIGIITFHNSYNCGSMLESYAIQTTLEKKGVPTEIIDFSSVGQREMYAARFKNNSIRNVVKNILIQPGLNKLEFNNKKYEEFKKNNFILSKNNTSKNSELSDDNYSIVVAGSDQIWNITIDDYDDAYYLNWVKKARKVAYAPSFGAKRIEDNTQNIDKYRNLLLDFDALSIREKNGQKWLKELINKDIPLLLDPTLLLEREDYEKIIAKDIDEKEKFIFFYCPSFNENICNLVKKIGKKYGLKVITWSTKSYYTRRINRYGFKLPKYESPAAYLYYIKNAELVITTSYHGTIFSTIFNKRFFTIFNGGMKGNDDRVITLLDQLKMRERLIPIKFDDERDYFEEVDYCSYNNNLPKLKRISNEYIDKNILNYYEKDK